jgi:hypothetical protein
LNASLFRWDRLSGRAAEIKKDRLSLSFFI